jgi:hypothetical protein
MSRTLPEGYVAVRVGEVEGFACSAAAAWLESVLQGGRTVYEAAAGGPDVRVGRAQVRVVAAGAAGPDGRGRWAVRRYHRGGAAARVLGDRHLRAGVGRPLRELRASVEARARGVRTPAVVAGAVYFATPFYRADIVTELVPDAPSLADVIFGGAARGAAGALAAAGRLVRSLEEARVLHADLSAGNIVVPLGGAGREAWAIDLDRCRVLPLEGRPPPGVMRRRLERSLRKLGHLHGRPLSALEWSALRGGWREAA